MSIGNPSEATRVGVQVIKTNVNPLKQLCHNAWSSGAQLST